MTHHEMFERAPAPTRTKQWYTVPLSILVHAVVLAVLVVVPLVATGVLPSPNSVMAFVAPTPPPPPMAPAPPTPPAPRTEVQVDASKAPIAEAERVTPEVPRPPSTFADVVRPGAVPFDGNNLVTLHAPPPLAPPPPVPADPIHVGGDIREPKLIGPKVAPIYPPLAITAKIAGNVYLEAVIGKDGMVRDLKVLGGPALLQKAAVDAVRQWRYTPTLLNGQPVEVIFTVTVTFKLGR